MGDPVLVPWGDTGVRSYFLSCVRGTREGLPFPSYSADTLEDSCLLGLLLSHTFFIFYFFQIKILLRGTPWAAWHARGPQSPKATSPRPGAGPLLLVAAAQPWAPDFTLGTVGGETIVKGSPIHFPGERDDGVGAHLAGPR